MARWLRRLAWAWLLALAAPAFAAHDVVSDIPYVPGSTDGDLTLDVYVPKGSATGSQARPVMIYVHGGGWGRGSKRVGRSLAGAYTDQGVVFVSLNYRLAPRNKYPVFMHDLAAAMLWIRDNIGKHGGDPKRLVLAGHSAGAHLVALLATDPQFLAQKGLQPTMFQLVAPVDTASFDFLVDPYGIFVRRQIKIREDAFGTDRATMAAASPTLVVAKAKPGTIPPFHIFVSSRRPDAMEQSEAFAKAIRGVGGTASVTSLDLGHAMINQAIGERESTIAKTLLDRLLQR